MKRAYIFFLMAVMVMSSVAALAYTQTFSKFSLYVPYGWEAREESTDGVVSLSDEDDVERRIIVRALPKEGSSLQTIAERECDVYDGFDLEKVGEYYMFSYSDLGFSWTGIVFDNAENSSFPSDVYCFISSTVGGSDFNTVFESISYNNGGGGGGGSSGGCNAGAFPLCMLLAGFALFRKK